MTRRTNSAEVEKEARPQQAIAAFRNKTKKASEAIRDFDVSCRTFYKRLGGTLLRNLAHESKQLLTHIQEQELVRWITRLTITGTIWAISLSYIYRISSQACYIDQNGRHN